MSSLLYVLWRMRCCIWAAKSLEMFCHTVDESPFMIHFCRPSFCSVSEKFFTKSCPEITPKKYRYTYLRSHNDGRSTTVRSLKWSSMQNQREKAYGFYSFCILLTAYHSKLDPRFPHQSPHHLPTRHGYHPKMRPMVIIWFNLIWFLNRQGRPNRLPRSIPET